MVSVLPHVILKNLNWFYVQYVIIHYHSIYSQSDTDIHPVLLPVLTICIDITICQDQTFSFLNIFNISDILSLLDMFFSHRTIIVIDFQSHFFHKAILLWPNAKKFFLPEFNRKNPWCYPWKTRSYFSVEMNW